MLKAQCHFATICNTSAVRAELWARGSYRRIVGLVAVVVAASAVSGLVPLVKGQAWAADPTAMAQSSLQTSTITPWTTGPVTPWSTGRYSRARLVTGRLGTQGDGDPLIAGVELEMAKGWKTYWRSTGDSAGVPPYFNFKGSANLKSAKVQYPAPHRYKAIDGDSIGYKQRVTFPIRFAAQKAGQPIALKLTFDYGICTDICVPVQAKFNMIIEPDRSSAQAPLALARAVAAIPRMAAARHASDPVLKAARAVLSGKQPHLVFEVSFPGGGSGADLFIEGPNEAFVPQPQPSGKTSQGHHRFVVDLTKGADLADLKDKPLRLTLVSDAGQAEVEWLLK